MKLLFCGDICFDKTIGAFDKRLVDVYKRALCELFDDADHVIANLESPLTGCDDAILKCGPNLKGDESDVCFLLELGIDIVTLANNHIGDYGEKGVVDTIRVLETKGIGIVGAGKNRKEAYNSFRIGSVILFSICENEFGISDESHAGSAGFDYGCIDRRIKEEKKDGDRVVLVYHGGCEFSPVPSPEIKDRMHNLSRMGTDLIICIHPHCPQGYERFENTDIYYSLGNFIFNNPDNVDPYSPWYFGTILSVSINDDMSFENQLIPYRYGYNGNSFYLLSGGMKACFDNYYRVLSDAILDDDYLKSYYLGWCYIQGMTYLRILNNVDLKDNESKHYGYAYIKNLFSCEAHRELMQSTAKLLMNDRIEEASSCSMLVKRLQYIPIELDEIKEFDKIDFHVDFDKEIKSVDCIVWGVSKLGMLSCVKLVLSGKRVKMFWDSNPVKQGGTVIGRKVSSPGEFLTNDVAVVLAIPVESRSSAIENLLSKCDFSGEIINAFLRDSDI